MVMEGHILEGCFPLRSHLGQTKIGDLRLSLQYIPDELVFSQPQATVLEPQGETSGSSEERFRIKICSLRGVYDPTFPGRKDPYVEVAVIQSKSDDQKKKDGKEEEEEGGPYSIATTTIAGDAFEQAHWDEVVEIKTPPSNSTSPWLIRLRLKTAALIKEDNQGDLLGQAYLPWPAADDHKRTIYQLLHPSSSVVIGNLTLTFLGRDARDDVPGPGYETTVVGDSDQPPPPMSPDKRKRPQLSSSSSSPSSSTTSLSRCAELQKCGPGLLLCQIRTIQEAQMNGRGGKARIVHFPLDSMYAKVREMQLSDDTVEGLEDASADLWSLSDTTDTQRPFNQRVYYPHDRLPPINPAAATSAYDNGLSTDKARGGQITVASILTPLCYGANSAVVMYLGQGPNAKLMRWLKGVINPKPAMSFPFRDIQDWRLLGSVSRCPKEDDKSEDGNESLDG